jgi:hypothetical protein
MIEGLLRHLTAAEIDRQYTDTHGATIAGFAFSELLGFSLMPRLKNIGSARLYRPGTGEDEAWPALDPVLSNKTPQHGPDPGCSVRPHLEDGAHRDRSARPVRPVLVPYQPVRTV